MKPATDSKYSVQLSVRHQSVQSMQSEQSMSMETYHGYVRTTLDALILFEACRLGVLSRAQRRLSERERKSITSGSVFVWDEREAGMRRWTDGKSWSASRVSGSFLTYREMEGKRPDLPEGYNSEGFEGEEDEKKSEDEAKDQREQPQPEGYHYKPNGLMKQSFSITTSTNLKLHLISYFTKSSINDLPIPSRDPNLKHINIPKGLYPDHAAPLDQHHSAPHLVPIFQQQQHQQAFGLGQPIFQAVQPGPPHPSMQVPILQRRGAPLKGGVQGGLQAGLQAGPQTGIRAAAPQYYPNSGVLPVYGQQPPPPSPPPPPPQQQQPPKSQPQQQPGFSLPPLSSQPVPLPLVTQPLVTQPLTDTSPLQSAPPLVSSTLATQTSSQPLAAPRQPRIPTQRLNPLVTGNAGRQYGPGQPQGQESVPRISSLRVTDIPFEKVMWDEDARAINVLDRRLNF